MLHQTKGVKILINALENQGYVWKEVISGLSLKTVNVQKTWYKFITVTDVKNLFIWNWTYTKWNSYPVIMPQAVNTARDLIRNSFIFSYK